MASREDRSNNKYMKALTNAAHTSDQNGADIDTRGFESVTFIATIGAEGDTLTNSLKIQLELEESADGSTYSNVAAGDMEGESGSTGGLWLTVEAAAEANAVYSVAYTGNLRYVRVVDNITGTHTNGTPTGVVAKLGRPRQAPVTQESVNLAD